MVEKQKFDLAVIGAGPGGYVAAIKAAQSGKTVALIERKDLGGTCLNVGCIPTKTLIANASTLKKISHAEDFGIKVGNVTFDFAKMKERKDSVVTGIRNSLGGLLKANGIQILKGSAAFVSPKELKVKGEQSAIISAEKIIIATGSDPVDIGAFPFDHKRILNSTSILELTELPTSLAVIGGGYIGCEFASLYQALGVKVTILEALPSIIALQGEQLSKELTKVFQKNGVDIKTGVMVEGIDNTGSSVTIKLKGGETVSADMALVSVGRKTVTDGLDIGKAGIGLTERGMIDVNERLETSVPGIYAIGDVTGIAMLAHVASHQGIIAATNACGGDARMHYNAVPAVIFTEPEIAMVGMTAEEAKKAGYEVSVGQFPFQALGKAHAVGETEGFAQVISDKRTGEVLGGQIMGPEASTLIAEIALAINNELTLECVFDTIHAHPTLPEAWMEAALMANGSPIHFPPKIKKG